jgi:MFS transporter, DHA2 family, methylenomycin A resistance protein
VGGGRLRGGAGAGLRLLPLFAPLAILAPVAGRVVARVGPWHPMAGGLALAAAGVGGLVRLGPDSGYGVLLPALLAWGIGLAVLTPAVVAAAVGSVEPERAGLASGINNTARQAGGAVGVAAYGAIAGPATVPHAFVAGVHSLGLVTAAVFATGALAGLTRDDPAAVGGLPAGPPGGRDHRAGCCNEE